MAYTALYRSLVDDKQDFFSTTISPKAVQDRAKGKDFRFLAQHHSLIEQELSQLFESLKRKDSNSDAFWLYAYYCSLMLHAYYQGYDKPDQVEKMKRLSDDILFRCENGTFAEKPHNNQDFLQGVQAKLTKELTSLASIPFHVSQIHDCVGLTNVVRIQIVFSKFVIATSLTAAREMHWLEQLDKLFGRHLDVSVMDNATGVFNGLSVGLFALRFILNAGLLLKHTVFPTEKESKLTLAERFKNEFNQRHVLFLNDAVWGVVNGLSNYAPYFNIPAPAANWLMAGFLVFDVAVLLYARGLAEQDYLGKKSQYMTEIKQHREALAGVVDSSEVKTLIERLNVLEEQLATHERNWQVTNAKFWFNTSAAVMLMGGFSAALLLSIPAAVSASFFVGTIAISMYVTADNYAAYKEKSFLLQEVELTGEDTTEAKLAKQSAQYDFQLAMAKNTLIPAMLMATLAVSMPAALLLTAAYLTYEWSKDCIPEQKTLPGASP